jgi:uncharacterized protein YbjT (DUF2867 family)
VLKTFPFVPWFRAHNGELATHIDGAKVVAGDFNDERSIAEALEGVDQAFLLTNSSELAEAQQITFVDVASLLVFWNCV